MIKKEIALKLKESGFPMDLSGDWVSTKGIPILENERVYIPDLSELIDACGNSFYRLDKMVHTELGKWLAHGHLVKGDTTTRLLEYADTPDEAVANLWLKLNQ